MNRTLDVQREEFKKHLFIGTPLAGLIIWAIICICSFFISEQNMPWIIFIGTGSIVYIGMFVSKFTGENFMDRSKPKNEFDHLFLVTVGMAMLVYSIAIPFFLIEPTSLPMTVGILTGLMWLPFSWIIEHWVGYFHTISRTILVLAAWYIFPDLRFTVIPLIIVAIYTITLIILRKRFNTITATV
jgi:hypothetical protein